MLDVFNIYETNEIVCAYLHNFYESSSRNNLNFFKGVLAYCPYNNLAWERTLRINTVILTSIYEFHPTNYASFAFT